MAWPEHSYSFWSDRPDKGYKSLSSGTFIPLLLRSCVSYDYDLLPFFWWRGRGIRCSNRESHIFMASRRAINASTLIICRSSRVLNWPLSANCFPIWIFKYCWAVNVVLRIIYCSSANSFIYSNISFNILVNPINLLVLFCSNACKDQSLLLSNYFFRHIFILLSTEDVASLASVTFLQWFTSPNGFRLIWVWQSV